jgi:hypothetical protein
MEFIKGEIFNWGDLTWRRKSQILDVFYKKVLIIGFHIRFVIHVTTLPKYARPAIIQKDYFWWERSTCSEH